MQSSRCNSVINMLQTQLSEGKAIGVAMQHNIGVCVWWWWGGGGGGWLGREGLGPPQFFLPLALCKQILPTH